MWFSLTGAPKPSQTNDCDSALFGSKGNTDGRRTAVKREWLWEIHSDTAGWVSACRSRRSPLDEIDSIAVLRILVYFESALFVLTFPRPQIDLKCTLVEICHINSISKRNLLYKWQQCNVLLFLWHISLPNTTGVVYSFKRNHCYYAKVTLPALTSSLQWPPSECMKPILYFFCSSLQKLLAKTHLCQLALCDVTDGCSSQVLVPRTERTESQSCSCPSIASLLAGSWSQALFQEAAKTSTDLQNGH